jgi:hypothetical protein
MIAPVILAALLAAAEAAPPTRDAPQPGAWGFDWLQPRSAKCRRLTGADLERFKHCDRDTPGFGEHKPTHACRVSEHSEWIVYATRAQCEDELATMKANGP